MNVRETEQRAKKYFDEIGDEIPTVSGLALAIGLRSRAELLNYEGSSSMSKVVKNALLQLESILEGKLYKKETFNGAKTVLQSNFGWQDSSDDTKTQTINEVRKILEGVGE